MTTLLEIRDLRLSIGSATILDGVFLGLTSGTITGLAGESGSGKTMTGMTICGLQPAKARVSGEIIYDGQDLLSLSTRSLNRIRGAEIAVVFQDPIASMHPMLNIGAQLTDHLRAHTGVSKKAARDHACDVLARLQVPNPRDALSKYPHQFSGGQLQRVAIASAIICEPRILIADEPTTALDVIVQAEILRVLRQLCDDLDLAILLVSHDFGVLSALAERIVVMQSGAVVEHGSAYDVINSPQHPYTQSLLASLPQHNPNDEGQPIHA